MSVSSPEALYHAIPKSPVDSSSTILPSDIDLDGDEPGSDRLPLEPIASDPPTALVNSRISWIHFVLGCAVLLPWNALITATPFFVSRLAGSPFQITFSSYISASFMIANFIFLAHATVTSKQTSPSRQILVTLLWLSFLTFLLFLGTIVHVGPGVFFAFVLLNCVAQAAASSYLQTSVIAVASLFGPTAVQSMLSGQAAVAVVVSGVQVLSAAASLWGESKTSVALSASDGAAAERSAFTFFGLSTVFLLFSAGTQLWLASMPVYKAVTAPLERQKTPVVYGDASERQGLVSGGRSEQLDTKGQILRVAKANLIYEIAVAYVFVVTLAVFPPITTSVNSTNPNTHPLLFSAVHFLAVNVGDFLGRHMCSFPRLLIWSAKRLLTLSLVRTLFIPLFLMCNVQRPISSIPSSPIISSDFLFMLLLLVFGISNGYLSSMCLMSAPSLEHNRRLKGRKEDVDVAATVTSFWLVSGLAIGSIASFAVRAAICNCNPFTQIA